MKAEIAQVMNDKFDSTSKTIYIPMLDENDSFSKND